MPKLLILASEFPPGPGGIGAHAYQLAAHLHQLKWDVRILTAQNYASEKEIRDFNARQAFQIARLLSAAGILKIFKRHQMISEEIQRWKPDLLLASGDRMVYLAAFAASNRKLPWVAVEHGRIPHFFEQMIKKWALASASAVISVSEYTQSQLLKSGVRPKERKVIPNGASEAQFKILTEPEVKNFRKKSSLENTRIILTVGHVSDRKGQDIVIRAMPEVLKEISNAHYCMMGLPTEKERFQKIAQELQIEKHIHFLGPVDAETLLGGLNACDVFVMTSRHSKDGSFEGYGISVVEAAFCAKPAVVSNNSGLAEAIKEGETGFGVPENNPGETAKAILKFLQDEKLRLRMGEAARQRALAEQTWEKRVKEYDQFLRFLLVPAATRRNDKI